MHLDLKQQDDLMSGVNWNALIDSNDALWSRANQSVEGHIERMREQLHRDRVAKAIAALGGPNSEQALQELYAINPELGLRMEDQLYQRGERQREADSRSAMSAILLNGQQPVPQPAPPTVANPNEPDPLAPLPEQPIAGASSEASQQAPDTQQEWVQYLGQVAEWADSPEKWDQAVDWFAANGYPQARQLKGRFSPEARAGLMRQGGRDPAERRLIEADPEAYLTFEGKRLDVTGKQLKSFIDLNNSAMQLLGGVRDQASYDAAKQQAAQLYSSFGHDASEFIGGLPQQYSPETIRMLQLRGMDTSKQLTAIARENNIESQIEVREQRAAEHARHNRAMEGNHRRGQDVRSRDTRRGQDVTDRRLRETGGRKGGAPKRGDLIGPVYQKGGRRIQYSKGAGGYVDVATGKRVN